MATHRKIMQTKSARTDAGKSMALPPLRVPTCEPPKKLEASLSAACEASRRKNNPATFRNMSFGESRPRIESHSHLRRKNSSTSAPSARDPLQQAISTMSVAVASGVKGTGDLRVASTRRINPNDRHEKTPNCCVTDAAIGGVRAAPVLADRPGATNHSVYLDPGSLHHLDPPFGLDGDAGRKLRRRRDVRRAADLGQPRPDLRIGRSRH